MVFSFKSFEERFSTHATRVTRVANLRVPTAAALQPKINF